MNMAWVVLTACLVFFMQAGFAMMETGMTRAKNVAHTMAMNVTVFSAGALGFWLCGFAFMFGGVGPLTNLGGLDILNKEFSLHILGKDFGLAGHEGFFLAGRAMENSVLALFFFQTMFMDTAVTIPTGAMAERWKFLSFVIYAFFTSMVLYPVYGNWVWGHGWLAQLGINFGLGHGHVDFAGASVVHMVGGFTALVGALVLGPRIGKFRPDGSPNPLPAHNVPMYMVGTLFLVFGWFGFNAGSTQSAVDPNIARIAANTALAAAAGAFSASCYMWSRFGKPDASLLCNGMLAGLVSITGSCAYVAPWAAVLIGLIAGVLTVWGVLFVERVLHVDDPVGAVSVHGLGGAWGVLALGLFADGTYAPHEMFNGVRGNVTGLMFGNPSQLFAQMIGIGANLIWVLPVSYLFFKLLDMWIGNRVSPQIEMQGLDVPELGALGYTTQEVKGPEVRWAMPIPAMEPRPARVPPNQDKRFTIVVDVPDVDIMTRVWCDLCGARDAPAPKEFAGVYRFMTTVQGNRFRFKGGDPQMMCTNLEKLFQDKMQGQAIRARLEP